MGRMRAAIKASAKARKGGTVKQLRVCWGGLHNVECEADTQGRIDAEEYPCCAAHGGKFPSDWGKA